MFNDYVFLRFLRLSTFFNVFLTLKKLYIDENSRNLTQASIWSTSFYINEHEKRRLTSD